MENIGRLFGEADFSRETNLKSRLSEQLFGGRQTKAKTLPFEKLSADQLQQVSAAGGIRRDLSPFQFRDNASEDAGGAR